MRAVVTGAGGFIGRHLCRLLRDSGCEIMALGRPDSLARNHAEVFIPIEKPDDLDSAATALRDFRPDTVFHLAGASSAASTEALYRINLFFAVHLLGICARMPHPPVFIVAGSAAEYGAPQRADGIMSESDRAAPVSAYGISKLAQTLHALARVDDMPVRVARLFNPLGPGMPGSSAPGRFVDEVVRLLPAGGIVETGPLDAIRDFSDVRDVASELMTLATRPDIASGIYNICCGEGIPISQITTTLAALAPCPVQFAPQKRDGGVKIAIGDTTRARRAGIIVPKPDLRETLRDMLEEAGCPVRPHEGP